MKREELLKEIMEFLPELISLWSQMTDKEKLEKVKQFRTKIEENYKK